MLPIEHWQAPSGAQVWLVHSPGIPMVDVHVAFDAGRRRDGPEHIGLAQAAALMSSKGVQASEGAPALDENALGEAWADLGASFGAEAGRDSFSYSLRSLTQPELLARAADLAARQMGQPSWPADVWSNERERWAASLREADTRPATVANKALVRALYGDHPYGYQVTPDMTPAQQKRVIMAFQMHFRPARWDGVADAQQREGDVHQPELALLGRHETVEEGKEYGQRRDDDGEEHRLLTADLIHQHARGHGEDEKPEEYERGEEIGS